jgi:hypothetical protein
VSSVSRSSSGAQETATTRTIARKTVLIIAVLPRWPMQYWISLHKQNSSLPVRMRAAFVDLGFDTIMPHANRNRQPSCRQPVDRFAFISA